MHRIATRSGDLDLEKKLESVKQSPADILFISTADTELSGLAHIWGNLLRKKGIHTMRLMQANPLQNPKAAEYYVRNVLSKSKLAILRLHGGYSYFSHLFDQIVHIKIHNAKTRILVLPGTDEWDHELMKFNDFEEPVVRKFFEYFLSKVVAYFLTSESRSIATTLQLISFRIFCEYPPWPNVQSTYISEFFGSR